MPDDTTGYLVTTLSASGTSQARRRPLAAADLTEMLLVQVKANGEHDPYIQQLSRAFHNWHYAGWAVLENDWANIPPKTVKGEWEPIVSTEEFERGLAILAKRSHTPSPNKRYFYLLQGLIYLQQENGKLRKLICGTPNANRARGGVSCHCVPSSNLNFLCWKMDAQIPEHVRAIQVDPDLIPEIRKVYLADMSRYTSNRHREIQALQSAIQKLEEKEINLWRAFTEHGMRPQIYEKLSRGTKMNASASPPRLPHQQRKR